MHSFTELVQEIKDYIDNHESSVSVDETGTASSTDTRYQRIGVNNTYTEIKGTKYMEQQVTLSTSADTEVTFTNSAITSSSAVRAMTTIDGLAHKSMTISNGQVKLVYRKQSTSKTPTIRIYIQ